MAARQTVCGGTPSLFHLLQNGGTSTCRAFHTEQSSTKARVSSPFSKFSAASSRVIPAVLDGLGFAFQPSRRQALRGKIGIFLPSIVEGVFLGAKIILPHFNRNQCPTFTRNPRLMYTANGKYVDAIPHLLGHGPDAYARDLEGTTALDLARASLQDRNLPLPRKKLRADPVPRP